MTLPRRDPHLGVLLSAFVDGALDTGARDRALVHLAHCDGCRASVDEQRGLKARLSGLAGPTCPDGLLDRLRVLPDRTAGGVVHGLPPAPLRARFRPVASASRWPAGMTAAEPRIADGSAEVASEVASHARVVPPPPTEAEAAAARPTRSLTRPAGGRPRGRPAGRIRARRPGRRMITTAAGGFAAFAISLAAVVVVGGTDEPEPVAPPVTTFTVEHSRVTTGVPGSDPDVGSLDVVHTGR